eukprot:2099464-Rhodomonas_salina.2
MQHTRLSGTNSAYAPTRVLCDVRLLAQQGPIGGVYCEIKYNKTQSQCNLYQECVFLYLISGRRQIDLADRPGLRRLVGTAPPRYAPSTIRYLSTAQRIPPYAVSVPYAVLVPHIA